MGVRRGFSSFAVMFLAAAMLTACGNDGGDGGTATPTTATDEPAATTEGGSTNVSIGAGDYSFDLPTEFRGGLTNLSFTNTGSEPHLAAFALTAPGATLDDVKAALTSPPSAGPPAGPPPFEEIAGFPPADPGATGNMTVTLPAGNYVVFCPIPSPDGTPHLAKGMITEVTVSEGPEGELPASIGTVNAVDFGYTSMPTLQAGENVVRLSNQGKQLHEINLIELGPDTTIEDAVAWFEQESGPPPMRFLSGVAVKPGSDGTTTLDLQSGSSYAFVCAIPDFLGDFRPHVTKGMFSSAFTVT